jgi:hypothetical protein
MARIADLNLCYDPSECFDSLYCHPIQPFDLSLFLGLKHMMKQGLAVPLQVTHAYLLFNLKRLLR